ncbi:MAG TPA: glycosyltransferase family 39 protein [Thermoanaerobaculia bacterium]|nr:glycosyltransferase family 39 protein [Thermoanaerobaculia bacterium]
MRNVRSFASLRMTSKRVAVIVLASAVMLIAAGLRLREIRRWSLNNDEIAEVRWSSKSFSGMMQEVRRDAVHPPLDYVLQFVMGRLGGPEWLRRLPPVLFGIGTVALIMILARLWFGTGAGIAAGFFAALAPMHIRYSQEVRPYSMALFFVCAALLALELYAMRRQRRWAIAWFVLVFLSGFTLYFAGMVAGATSVFRIFVARRDALTLLWKRLPLIVLAWTVLYAPWLFVVIRLANEKPPQPPDTLDWPWWQLRVQTFAAGDWRFEPVTLGSWAFWICVAMGAIAAIRFKPLRIALFWFAAGTALEILVLQLRPHYSTPRYLMASWPGAFILAGAAIAWLMRSAPGRAAVPFILLLFAGHAALTLHVYYSGERSDWRGIAEYVYSRVKAGDNVMMANNWVQRNFGYYWAHLPARYDVGLIRYEQAYVDWPGPLWIVTGQCQPRQPLKGAGVMERWPMSEEAEVVYVRPGQKVSMKEELCPE